MAQPSLRYRTPDALARQARRDTMIAGAIAAAQAAERMNAAPTAPAMPGAPPPLPGMLPPPPPQMGAMTAMGTPGMLNPAPNPHVGAPPGGMAGVGGGPPFGNVSPADGSPPPPQAYAMGGQVPSAPPTLPTGAPAAMRPSEGKMPEPSDLPPGIISSADIVKAALSGGAPNGPMPTPAMAAPPMMEPMGPDAPVAAPEAFVAWLTQADPDTLPEAARTLVELYRRKPQLVDELYAAAREIAAEDPGELPAEVRSIIRAGQTGGMNGGMAGPAPQV